MCSQRDECSGLSGLEVDENGKDSLLLEVVSKRHAKRLRPYRRLWESPGS